MKLTIFFDIILEELRNSNFFFRLHLTLYFKLVRSAKRKFQAGRKCAHEFERILIKHLRMNFLVKVLSNAGNTLRWANYYDYVSSFYSRSNEKSFHSQINLGTTFELEAPLFTLANQRIIATPKQAELARFPVKTSFQHEIQRY